MSKTTQHKGEMISDIRDERAMVEHEENRANARLIAAAPDLLTALERLVNWGEFLEHNADCGQTEAQLREGAEQAARAAIAKAKGKEGAL